MKSTLRAMRPGALVVVTALLTACSGSKKDADPPAQLTDFRSTAKIERVWSASVGGGEPHLRLKLGLALAGNTIFAAGHDGDVIALDVATGKRLWRVDTKLPLTGGPGVGEGLVVVGASHGDLVALDAATGTVKWKVRYNSEILAAPAIGRDKVLVRMVDGRVVALRSNDGSQLWSAEQNVPRLSLRGTTGAIFAGDIAVCGFDNGRLMAMSLNDGATLWDVAVSPPSGRSELDRLVDVDSGVQVVGNDIYAVTFQGKAARIDRESGTVQWSRDLSSYSGLALDEDGLYVSTSKGTVAKIGRRTGIELWKNEVLANRRLSPPAVTGPYVAVADFKGIVHVLDGSNGALVARAGLLGTRVSSAPVVSGDLVVMTDEDGKIAAFRTVPLANPKKQD